MEVFEAIYALQSVGKVKPDLVPRELLEKLLSAAVQAPNHHKVRPWRFVIMTGQAREKLGEAMAQSLHAVKPEATVDDLQRERLKPLRAPVLVAVAVDKPTLPKVIEIENICAAAAAVQNLLLAAHALGLGAMWRTGAAATDPAIKHFLGLEADQHLIGFVYVGYPRDAILPRERPSFEDRTVWME